jgi:hypothetical protein
MKAEVLASRDALDLLLGDLVLSPCRDVGEVGRDGLSGRIVRVLSPAAASRSDGSLTGLRSPYVNIHVLSHRAHQARLWK